MRPTTKPRVDRPSSSSARGLRGALVLLLSLCACTSQEFVAPAGPAPATAAAHVFVTRPLRAEDSEDPFVNGVNGALIEKLIWQGYDVTGTTFDPLTEAALRKELEAVNARRPGTAAIHLTFVETPHLVGLGTSYLSIHCSIYLPNGEKVHDSALTVPAFNPLTMFLIPTKDPHTKGRRWLRESWLQVEPHFPPR